MTHQQSVTLKSLACSIAFFAALMTGVIAAAQVYRNAETFGTFCNEEAEEQLAEIKEVLGLVDNTTL